MIPTRWRVAFTDQLADARQRLLRAEGHLRAEDGSRALQEAYPAVIGAATVQVWLAHPPWERALPPLEMQRQVRETLPNLFAALAELDLQRVLTGPWRPSDAAPYVSEATAFVNEVERAVEAWLSQA